MTGREKTGRGERNKKVRRRDREERKEKKNGMGEKCKKGK